jgi:hypothetical protein
MPGSNAGTGHRLHARCYHCSRSRGRRGYELHLTGERRYRPNNNGASRRVDVFWQYQIRCAHCGRLGWTRHMDIAKRWLVRERV